MSARKEDEKIRFGPIPYCEHFGLWKASSQDADVTERKYDEVYDVLRSWLRDYLKAQGLSPDPFRTCYVIGDFYGQRTQHLQFPDYGRLTPHWVRELQRFLIGRGLDNWRISIGAATPEEVILIYPTVVCQDHALAENEIDPVVTDMSRRHVEMDRARKQASRIGETESVICWSMRMPTRRSRGAWRTPFMRSEKSARKVC